MTEPSARPNPMRRVIALRDFRLLFGGTSLSLLGDQFALIATPWLVLQLTGDPLKLGIVLALEGLPRAAFMLIGGAITDRLSPRRMMLVADTIRLGLTALMAVAVLGGAVELWMLYAFSLAFGLVAGFAVPAENSIVPMLVQSDDLQAGNALIMGITQIAGFVGPTLAGIVIGAYASSLTGVGLAFAIDAASFAVSAGCLVLMRGGGLPGAQGRAGEGIFAAIGAAFRYLWQDEALRLMFLLLAAINFLLIGPLLIGIPLLAKERLPEGAVAFGTLMAAFSAGNLVGFILAGSLPRPGGRGIKAILLTLLFGFGAMVDVLGYIGSTLDDFVLLAALGLGNGYVAILLFTWMQNRTPKEMLGRVMSFLMFANTGLVPLSQALSGGLGRYSLDAMFVTAGGLAVLVTLWAATRPALTVFAESLAAGAEG
ncbi:MFS transporter [Acidimangrovimonas pyrenivorans]|uniref:MFS transporter n=1 Tax=Acidimangrovimonas pyrenivorans TaxID=2030798 RepID=A0ABV7AI60_9RHOB